MKVYRNTTEIKKKDTLGRRLSLAGMGVLFVGLLASFVPTWIDPLGPPQPGINGFLQQYWSWISFGALFIGFFLASVGSYFINRFARRRWPGSRLIERPDEVLERNLKGFDDKYAFFSHSLPTTYLMAGPNGVTIFAVRSDRGRVTVEGDRWREPFSITRIFTAFAREGVGNPNRDLEEQKARIQSLLAQSTGDGAAPGVNLAEVPINGAAVFLNSAAQLEINNPSVPVLRADQLKDYLRSRAKEVKLSNATQRGLVEFLAQKATYQAEENE
jgi:hypothetical protein